VGCIYIYISIFNFFICVRVAAVLRFLAVRSDWVGFGAALGLAWFGVGLVSARLGSRVGLVRLGLAEIVGISDRELWLG